MKQTTKAERIRSVFIGLLGVYLVLLMLVFLNQRSMLYYPFPGPLPSPAQVGLDMQVAHLATDDNLSLVAWYAPPKKKDLPVVVVFHGNAATIAHRRPIADAMMKKGFGVFLCEYRGFAGNPGSPTEEGLYKDARASLAWLKNKGYKPGQLVYYGESLGTGVAVQMAIETPPSALVLQSSYSRMADVAGRRFWYFPVSLLILDKYDSIAKIGKVKAPVLVIHGARDALIPIALPRKLFDAAGKPKDFITIKEGGHNDLYDYGAGPAITGWIEKQVHAK